MRRICFVGELNRYTGYGQHSVEIIKFLQRQGYYVSVRALGQMTRVDPIARPLLVFAPQPEPTELLLTPPHHAPTPGKRVLYFTMWESTKLRDSSVRMLNMAAKVIVPCEWNRVNFIKSGVKRPIEVVQLGIDPATFDYRQMQDGPCVFGAAGNLRNGSKRKGVGDVVRIFRKTFPNEKDVRLRIKCLPGCNIEKVDDDRIELVKEMMDDAKLAEWYASLTCFASMAKAEGWGLMQQQAMACGRPVIAAPYGGLAEFLDESVGYPVGFKEVPAEEMWSGYGMWCQPNMKQFSQRMREVYEDRSKAEKLGWEAHTRATEFTWDRSNAKVLELFDRL